MKFSLFLGLLSYLPGKLAFMPARLPKWLPHQQTRLLSDFRYRIFVLEMLTTGLDSLLVILDGVYSEGNEVSGESLSCPGAS